MRVPYCPVCDNDKYFRCNIGVDQTWIVDRDGHQLDVVDEEIAAYPTETMEDWSCEECGAEIAFRSKEEV